MSQRAPPTTYSHTHSLTLLPLLQVRRLKYRIALSLFFLSVFAELAGGAVLLALHFNQNEFIVSVVGAVHGFGCVIAAASGVVSASLCVCVPARRTRARQFLHLVTVTQPVLFASTCMC